MVLTSYSIVKHSIRRVAKLHYLVCSYIITGTILEQELRVGLANLGWHWSPFSLGRQHFISVHCTTAGRLSGLS